VKLGLSLEDFRDAIRIYAHRFRPAKINQQPVVLRRADISGVFEGVLRAVVESDGKGPKRAAFHPVSDFRNFHGEKVASDLEYGKRKIDRGLIGERLPTWPQL
jgi:hypothetical protein